MTNKEHEERTKELEMTTKKEQDEKNTSKRIPKSLLIKNTQQRIEEN